MERQHSTMQKSLITKMSLASYKMSFTYKKTQFIWMAIHSVLLSKRAEATLLDLLDSWKTLGIDGWTEGDNPWFYLSESVGEKMAPLVGGMKSEVIATGSTTTNLHQLVATFYKPSGNKTKILADELNFPSDIYALKSQLALKGYDPDEHLVQGEKPGWSIFRRRRHYRSDDRGYRAHCFAGSIVSEVGKCLIWND